MGFEKEILTVGNGVMPRRGQQVTVHCTGYGKNRDLSLKFWSTKDAGQQPFTFQIGMGQVIKGETLPYQEGDECCDNNQLSCHYTYIGWDEGVASMSIGEVARLTCSPDYAYGPGGFPAWGIMPNSILVFEIEVLSAC